MATVQMRVSEEDLSQVPKGNERVPEPAILVIFGASGDLTKRKLLPALYHLQQNHLLPAKFAIVGVARRALGDAFAADMREGIIEFGGVDKSDPKLDDFVSKIGYFALNFDDPSHYAALKAESTASRPGEASAATGSTISPPRRSFLPGLSTTLARRAWRSRKMANPLS